MEWEDVELEPRTGLWPTCSNRLGSALLCHCPPCDRWLQGTPEKSRKHLHCTGSQSLSSLWWERQEAQCLFSHLCLPLPALLRAPHPGVQEVS